MSTIYHPKCPHILISFIIPVFNGEKTIVRAMDSALALPFDGNTLEIIAVDDCSDDHTIEKVAEYSESHPQVKLLRQDRNSRQGTCRNRGLEVAAGRYVVYLDADDVILPGICQAVEKSAVNDLEMCGYVMEIPDKNGVVHLLQMPQMDESYCSGIKLIGMGQDGYRFLMPTCFVFKREFLMECNHPFVEGQRVEDSDFALYHLIRAEKVSTVQDHGYLYYFNPGSTIHTFSKEMLTDYMLHAERVCLIMDEFRDSHPELPSFYRNYMGEIVFNRFSLWYLSHLRFRDILNFYKLFDKNRRYALSNCDFIRYKKFQALTLNHKFLTLSILFWVLPFKKTTRKLRSLSSKGESVN